MKVSLQNNYEKFYIFYSPFTTSVTRNEWMNSGQGVGGMGKRGRGEVLVVAVIVIIIRLETLTLPLDQNFSDLTLKLYFSSELTLIY